MERYEEFDINELMEYEEQDGFEIDSASKAEWALKQIDDRRKRCDYFIKCANDEINQLKERIKQEQQKCDNETNFLTYKLGHYMEGDNVPKKKTKTQISVTLPAGKIIKKLPKVVIMSSDGKEVTKVKDKKEFVDEIYNLDSTYIKTKMEVDWAMLKKDLEVIDGSIFMKDTGEIIESLSAVEQPAIIEVKTNV